MDLLIGDPVSQLAAPVRAHEARLAVFETQDMADFMGHDPGVAEHGHWLRRHTSATRQVSLSGPTHVHVLGPGNKVNPDLGCLQWGKMPADTEALGQVVHCL